VRRLTFPTACYKTSGTRKETCKTVWEVEFLGSDGNVTEVHIDAASGAVIETEAKKDEKKKEGRKGK
jgi:uncharacterized membrane protein YkoI